MLQVDVSGVIESKRKQAEESIKSYLSVFSDSDTIVHVIVASDFEKTVDRFRSQRAKQLLGPYSRTHQRSAAKAKTMPFLENGKLSFKLIIAGDVYAKWEESQWTERLLTLLHESSHIVDSLCDLKNYGQDRVLRLTESLHEKYELVASTVMGEYRAERYALTALNNAIKELDHNGYFTSSIYDDFADTLIEMLRGQIDFVTDTVGELKRGQIDGDACLLKLGYRIEELVKIAAYVYGQTDALENYRHLITKVESINEFDRFLGKPWKSIVSKLRQLYDAEGCQKDSDLQDVVTELKIIYMQCGLTLTETPDGLHFQTPWG